MTKKNEGNETQEARVLAYMLGTKPKPHKPMGKNPQAKRRAKEKRQK